MFYVLSNNEYKSVQAMTVSAFASDGFHHPDLIGDPFTNIDIFGSLHNIL